MARERVRSIRNTPYRLRAQGHCVLQRLQQKQRLKTFSSQLLIATIGNQLNNDVRKVYFVSSLLNFLIYKRNKSVVYREFRWEWKAPAKFANFDSLWCWQHLRFKKKHLLRISQALRLPEEFRLCNGSWTTNQEMLIVLLARLGSTSKWLKLEQELGIEYSRMSRIFQVRESINVK